MYGAVNGQAPSGVHYLRVNGREYPVAKLHIENLSGPDGERTFYVADWAYRTMPFPEKIKGYNE
jgi:hypothetical protein